MFYKLTIAYEGTNYNGWQVQPTGKSIQATIQEALHRILQEPVKVIGSGRTDAGVHALGQVAHFQTEKKIDAGRTLFSLNALLPKDIRIISLEPIFAKFHAQYHAISKIYRYHLYFDKILNPFKRGFVWHIPQDVDIELLKKASRYLLGTHDFTSFSNEASKGVASKDPVRTLFRIDIIPEEGGVAIEFEGDGFLYKMVRNMVAMLIDCGLKKRAPEEILTILAAKDRRKASQAAPAQGLFLVNVRYRQC